MQKVKIPRMIDPTRAAQKRLDYTGIIQISLFKRLSESVEAINQDANVSLSFVTDEQQLTVISGKANIEVELQCQRCNENFKFLDTVSFTCTPYLGEENAEQTPDIYDLVDLNEYGELDLIALVEDELIVNLPQIAMHDDADCSVDTNHMVFGELPDDDVIVTDKPNPFDVLKTLKK